MKTLYSQDTPVYGRRSFGERQIAHLSYSSACHKPRTIPRRSQLEMVTQILHGLICGRPPSILSCRTWEKTKKNYEGAEKQGSRIAVLGCLRQGVVFACSTATALRVMYGTGRLQDCTR